MLENLRNQGKKVIVVQGLGFVGAVMSLVCCNSHREEYAVIGVDLPSESSYWRIKSLNEGEFPLVSSDKKVYEFYYMRYLQNANNWLIEDYKSLQNLIGYKEFSKPIIYKYLLPSFKKERIKKINKNIKNFVESREYFLQPKHIN